MDHATLEHLLDQVKAHSGMIAISACPLVATMLAKLVFGNNKLMLYAVRGSMAWMAMRVILSPFLQMAKDNVSYLSQLSGR